ncbi:serine/threonine protein kinase Ran1 [Conglomerata obtusa]
MHKNAKFNTLIFEENIDQDIYYDENSKNDWETVKINLIKINDIIKIRNKQIIPVDGILLSGYAETDNKCLTGESEPVIYHKGDIIYAGTTNLTVNILLQVLYTKNKTLQGQIISIVKNQNFNKIKKNYVYVNYLMKYCFIICVFYYLLFIIGIRPVALYSNNIPNFLMPLHIAASVFVVVCPCAITLNEPLVMMVISNILRKRGILLSNIKQITKKPSYIVFHKTGTLTDGLKLTSLVCMPLHDNKVVMESEDNFEIQNNVQNNINKILADKQQDKKINGQQNFSFDKNKKSENKCQNSIEKKLEFFKNINEKDICYILLTIEQDINHPVARAIRSFCKPVVENNNYAYKIIRTNIIILFIG